MRVRYTDPATDDLEEIIEYFRVNVPSLVGELANAIDEAVSKLLDNPLVVQETEKSGVRRYFIRRFRYSIFFTVENDELIILHIRHAARRWPWEEQD